MFSAASHTALCYKGIYIIECIFYAFCMIAPVQIIADMVCEPQLIEPVQHFIRCCTLVLSTAVGPTDLYGAWVDKEGDVWYTMTVPGVRMEVMIWIR